MPFKRQKTLSTSLCLYKGPISIKRKLSKTISQGMSTGIKFFISLLGLDYFFNSVAWYFMTHTCTYTHTHKCQTYASHVKVWIKSVKELTNLLHITHPNLLCSITIEHTHADQDPFHCMLRSTTRSCHMLFKHTWCVLQVIQNHVFTFARP